MLELEWFKQSLYCDVFLECYMRIDSSPIRILSLDPDIFPVAHCSSVVTIVHCLQFGIALHHCFMNLMDLLNLQNEYIILLSDNCCI